jgi:dTDP-4-amino-4,6-dideoxygalactose transaminase
MILMRLTMIKGKGGHLIEDNCESMGAVYKGRAGVVYLD